MISNNYRGYLIITCASNSHINWFVIKLYQTIKQNYQAKPSKTLNEILDIIQYDFCHDGQYSKLWNGHTTLNFNNQFVVYDVWTLFDQDIPKITAAQLYLVLAVIKAEVKHNQSL